MLGPALGAEVVLLTCEYPHMDQLELLLNVSLFILDARVAMSCLWA